MVINIVSKKLKKVYKKHFNDKTSKILLLIIGLILIFNVFFYFSNYVADRDYDEGEIRFKDLEEGNGAFINIWMHETWRLDRLKENNMKYLFVDVGDTNKNGKIESVQKDIEKFLGFIERYEDENDYDFILLPYSEIITKDYDINSFEFQNNFIDDYTWLVEVGFDGVLIDIEYVPRSKQESYLNIIDSLSEELPREAIMSAYVIGIDEWPNHWEWSPEFFEAVADRMDLIELSSYDTDIENLREYKNHVEDQIGRVAHKQWNSNFIFSVPTHKQSPETIENSLDSFKIEIAKHHDHQFIGIVIFAEWTTNDEEWDILEQKIDDIF